MNRQKLVAEILGGGTKTITQIIPKVKQQIPIEVARRFYLVTMSYPGAKRGKVTDNLEEQIHLGYHAIVREALRGLRKYGLGRDIVPAIWCKRSGVWKLTRKGKKFYGIKTETK